MKILAFSLLLVLALTSCENQQTLCLDHEAHSRLPVDVVFDWSRHPEASPRSMSLYLFPLDGGESIRYEFSGREGGRVLVPRGRYTAIALNSDTESTKVRGSAAYEAFEIWLREDGAVDRIRSNRLVGTSDLIWTASTDLVEVNTATDSRVIEMAMGEAVCRCHVDVRNVANHAGISAVKAVLSGMNESVMVAHRAGGDARVNIGFDLNRSAPGELTASFLTLGHCGAARLHGVSTRGDDHDEEPLHILSLYVTLNDGSGWRYDEDVSAQIHASDVAECHIVIDSLDVPRIGTPGGFDLSVGGWESVHIPIKP